MSKPQKHLKKLRSITPSYAYKIINGEPRRLPAEEVAVSDVVMVKKGDAFSIDGVVIKGGSVDEATLTGEPLPRDVSVGDKVYAGTINCSSVIFVKAIKDKATYWGDIDLGGFSMLLRLRKEILPSVQPYLMGKNELLAFQSYTQTFSKDYAEKLRRLSENERLGRLPRDD